MITYPYDKFDVLIPEVYRITKQKLEEEHEEKKRVDPKKYLNTRRKFNESDIKIIMNEYFKDLALWLENPNSSIYSLGALGYIKISFMSIDAFLKRILFPKYRTGTPQSIDLTKRRINFLWKLRQKKYGTTIDTIRRKELIDYRVYNRYKLNDYQPSKYISHERINLIKQTNRNYQNPDPKYGDLFDIKVPKLEKQLISNVLSANLNRKDFEDILKL